MLSNNSTLQQTNKVVLKINWILDTFLMLGYLGELIKGAKSFQFIVAFYILILIPVVTANLIYIKNRESAYMKYITLFGYFVIYVFVMFTAAPDKQIVFVYVFPILLMYFLYFNIRIMWIGCGLALIINIAKILYYLFGLGINDSVSTTNYTIQMAAVVLYSISLITSTKLSNQFNKDKIKSINEEKHKQSQILSSVLEIGAILDNNSKEVNSIVGELTETTNTVAKAINDIVQEASETAASVSDQFDQTRSIHTNIKVASDTSELMNQISKDTGNAVDDGLEIMENLTEKSEQANKINESTYRSILELKEKSEQIQKITKMITSISDQTNLLSLNAAIESSRAGEAGRGFAVVAERIRILSRQSKQSADSITKIINDLNKQTSESLDAMVNLRHASKEQNEMTLNTKTIFRNIHKRMNELSKNIEDVSHQIKDIVCANDKVIESISQVSAMSDAVTTNAHSAKTLSDFNLEKSERAKKLVDELIESSNKMQKYM